MFLGALRQIFWRQGGRRSCVFYGVPAAAHGSVRLAVCCCFRGILCSFFWGSILTAVEKPRQKLDASDKVRAGKYRPRERTLSSRFRRFVDGFSFLQVVPVFSFWFRLRRLSKIDRDRTQETKIGGGNIECRNGCCLCVWVDFFLGGRFRRCV